MYVCMCVLFHCYSHQEMELMKHFQILDKSAGISLWTSAISKGMKLYRLPPAIGEIIEQMTFEPW